LPPRIRNLVYAGQPLLVGIRPEALRVTNVAEQVANDSAQAVQLAGVVEVVEADLGRRIQWLHLRMDNQGFVASAAPEEPVYVGNQVTVSASSEDLHFFDAASELRLG
jgi:ABC-type sugar transport system ATPase subunit